MTPQPLLVIVGETCSGKTDLSLTLAKRFNGAIISADSVAIRRKMDIGSSKPSAKEQSEVPHYLIDIIDPSEEFSVALYKQKALKAIRNIGDNNKLAILVGGSGLYINSVIYDYRFRENLNKYQRDLLETLDIQKLKEIGTDSGLAIKSIDLNNKRRLIRLIETGHIRRKDLNKARGNTLIIGLYNSKENKKELIKKRVEKMINDGLEKEVQALRSEYGYNDKIFCNIGYKEWIPYFNNQICLDEVISNIVKDTSNLAKKQKTWFRRNKSIRWFNYPLQKHLIVELVTSFISNEHFN